MYLIRYFQDALESSIQVKIKSQEEEFENWDMLIRKATATDVKTWKQLTSKIKKVDQYYSEGYHPNVQANKPSQQVM